MNVCHYVCVLLTVFILIADVYCWPVDFFINGNRALPVLKRSFNNSDEDNKVAGNKSIWRFEKNLRTCGTYLADLLSFVCQTRGGFFGGHTLLYKRSLSSGKARKETKHLIALKA